MARPKLLDAAMIEAITDAVAIGGRPESVGVSSRSVQRWRQRGRSELAALSVEARLELELLRAEEKVRALSWRETARRLDEFAADWEPFGDF